MSSHLASDQSDTLTAVIGSQRARWALALAAGTFSRVDDVVDTYTQRAELKLAQVSEPEALPDLLAGVDGLLVGLQPLTAEHLRALPETVRVIGRAGIGLDSIDLGEAERLGLTVVHQPDYATSDVADHAAALILALNRRVLVGDGAARSAWPSLGEFADIRPLEECTLGIAGCGRIGRAVAERMTRFVAEVVAFDPAVDDLPAGIRRAETLEGLLEEADIVTLHMPLTPATRNAIDEQTLRRMKPTALLVNVARGGLIDEAALARALEAGRLGGAALDVLSEEPPPPDHPLLSTPQTILTPHVAWLSARGQTRLKSWTVEAMLDVLEERTPTHGRVAVQGTRAGAARP